MFKMLVGISLISVASEIFLSGGAFKKYVNAIMGIFAFLIMAESIFSLTPVDFNTSFLEEAESLSDLSVNEAEKELVEAYEENIEEELKAGGIKVSEVKVGCDGKLNIKSVEITVENEAEQETAQRILAEKFGLDGSFASVEYKRR